MIWSILLAPLIVLILSTVVPAQELIQPKQALPLRESPPGSFFRPKGEKIGTALPEEKYIVLEKRTVPTLFGSELWLKIQTTDSRRREEGWVYSGPGEASASNIVPAR